MTHYVFLKPHSGNLKLDNNLQFFCHMTSDVRFSHMPFFFLFTYTIFECWKALWKKTKLDWNETKKCIHLNIFTGKCQWWCPFSYILKYEGLQFYEKQNTSQMLSCKICKVLQNIIFAEDCWRKQPSRDVLQKRCSWKFRKITCAIESLF